MLIARIKGSSGFRNRFTLELSISAGRIACGACCVPGTRMGMRRLGRGFRRLGTRCSGGTLVSRFRGGKFACESGCAFAPARRREFDFCVRTGSCSPLRSRPFTSVGFAVLGSKAVVASSSCLPGSMGRGTRRTVSVLRRRLNGGHMVAGGPIPTGCLDGVGPHEAVGLGRGSW